MAVDSSRPAPEINRLIAAVEDALAVEDIDVESACQGVIDFALEQELRIVFSGRSTLKFVSGDQIGETARISKGIFRTFCARLAVLGAGGNDLPPLYGGPLLFAGVAGTLVNTMHEQSVVLAPVTR